MIRRALRLREYHASMAARYAQTNLVHFAHHTNKAKGYQDEITVHCRDMLLHLAQKEFGEADTEILRLQHTADAPSNQLLLSHWLAVQYSTSLVLSVLLEQGPAHMTQIQKAIPFMATVNSHMDQIKAIQDRQKRGQRRRWLWPSTM